MDLFRLITQDWLDDTCIDAKLLLLADGIDNVNIVKTTQMLFLHKKKIGATVQTYFKSGITFVPINFHQAHWTMLVVDSDKKMITMFDPFQTSQYYDAMDEQITKHIQPLLSDYCSYQTQVFEALQQDDGINCGVYILLYAEIVLRRNNLLQEKPLNTNILTGTELESLRFKYFCQLLTDITFS